MASLRRELLTTAAVVSLGGGVFVAGAGAANAADIGLKSPAPAPIPYSTWTGPYIGGTIGIARLNEATGANGFSSSEICSYYTADNSCVTSATGVAAGVQIGYDWQERYFVYGVAADWTWTDLNHSTTAADAANRGTFTTNTAKVDWLASFRGRAGIALDDTLVYLTGGLALAELKSNVVHRDGNGSPVESYGALNGVTAGWVAGAGVEHKLNRNWSVAAEFLYYDLGRQSASATTPHGTFTNEFNHEIMTGRLGVNYRW